MSSLYSSRAAVLPCLAVPCQAIGGGAVPCRASRIHLPPFSFSSVSGSFSCSSWFECGALAEWVAVRARTGGVDTLLELPELPARGCCRGCLSSWRVGVLLPSELPVQSCWQACLADARFSSLLARVARGGRPALCGAMHTVFMLLDRQSLLQPTG